MADKALSEFEKERKKHLKMAIKIPWIRKPRSLHIHAMNIGPPFRRKFVWIPFVFLMATLYYLLTSDTYQLQSGGYAPGVVRAVTEPLLDIEETVLANSQPSLNNTQQQDYLIPRRIHQSWISNEVVHMSSMWIKTWLQHNPDWEYWFWTPAEAMPFLKKHYSEYVALYESFRDSAQSEDLMRYLVLHHYGGFFVDLDMKCLKPLDTWALMYSCFVSKEPYEHIFLYGNTTIHTVANGLLVCRPGHPFLLSAVKQLASLKKSNKLPLFNGTGSRLLADVLQDYRKTQAPNDSKNEVKLIPPKYFMATYDESRPDITRQLREKCSSEPPSVALHANEKAVCRSYSRRNGDNSPSNDSFTNHFWLPLHGENSKRLYTISIFKIVPNAKTFRNNGGVS